MKQINVEWILAVLKDRLEILKKREAEAMESIAGDVTLRARISEVEMLIELITVNVTYGSIWTP